MLEIKNISKQYKTGDLVQVALNGVSLNLRDNEFVAILGPSGSGKTTLLNIIGGLDRYDSGDLIINNVSTKDYKDRDWDSYRNHTIGFVFQSYNLIPHQSVLANVELALTIAGISSRERRKRALDALDKVGLKEQAHKKPNQMSGGQMQRVAIARALVNNPDILLADEPTGALDTSTSIQVMELLKEVAKDRLVVMVTHNPELAEEYANRIVRVKDGNIISDSNPFTVEDKSDRKVEKRNLGKAHMSLFTALSLSFNNLLTKKGRTILTAFAGSIGIIGIALILSLSTGFQNYIDKIQQDTLSSYPLTLNSETADTTSAILSMVTDRRENKVEGDLVREQQYMSTMFSSIGSNDLTSFKHFLENNEDLYKDDVKLIKYSYSITPQIYTIDAVDKLTKVNPSSMMSSMYSSSAMSMLSGGGGGVFSEMSDDREAIVNNYDVLSGRWPERYNEMVVVLSEKNSISDLLVYSLGLRSSAELRTMITELMEKKDLSIKHDSKVFSYDDLMNLDFRLLDVSDTYKYNSKYDIYEDMSEDEDFMMKVFDKSLKLDIVGVVCPKENGSNILSPGVAFTKELTAYVIDKAYKSEIVQKQLKNTDVDVFSNKPFDDVNEDNKQSLNFNDMITIDNNMIKDAFKINISSDSFMSQEDMTKLVMSSSNAVVESLENTGVAMTEMVKSMNDGIANAMIAGYSNTAVSSPDCENYAMNMQGFVIEQMGCKLNNPQDEEELALYDKDTVNYPNNWMMTLMTNQDIICEEYVNQANHFLGCKVAEGSESDYTSFDIYTRKENKYKKTYYFMPQVTDAYKNAFFEESAFSTIMNVLPAEVTSVIDAKTLIEVTKDVAIKAFDKYVVEARALSSDPITYKVEGSALEAIDVNAIIAEAIENHKDAINLNGLELAKKYSALLVAKEIGTVVAKTMEPLTKLMGNDLMTIDSEKFAQAFKFNSNEDEIRRIMEAMMSGGSSLKTATGNLRALGYQNEDDPTSISFFFKSFEAKENFLEVLNNYNDKADDDHKIRYTDLTGILMSSVKTIVDSVSYVLIAFVSISLIVSSIMIAVITLISVMERTKEIGILRAMGASKSNVSSIFNAETFIIGLLSGLIGVGFTYAAVPVINTIIHNVTDNYDINAVLPHQAAIALVLISVVLTLIAGLIPSRSAAKKDPVLALRSE